MNLNILDTAHFYNKLITDNRWERPIPWLSEGTYLFEKAWWASIDVSHDIDCLMASQWGSILRGVVCHACHAARQLNLLAQMIWVWCRNISASKPLVRPFFLKPQSYGETWGLLAPHLILETMALINARHALFSGCRSIENIRLTLSYRSFSHWRLTYMIIMPWKRNQSSDHQWHEAKYYLSKYFGRARPM